MDDLFNTTDGADNAGDKLHDAGEFAEIREVPNALELLPDGREAVVIGDPRHCADTWRPAGDNPWGFEQTCGLSACTDVLGQFGIAAHETDLLGFALDHDLCHVGDVPAESGGTTCAEMATILEHYGVPAHVESGGSLEGLAEAVEEGRGVIAAVNEGALPGHGPLYDYGEANHVVTVTGVARDPATGEVLGFYVNDSADPADGAARFIDARSMSEAWEEAGGTAIYTDRVKIYE